MSRRDEEKKRRRQKRLSKRRDRDDSSFSPALDETAIKDAMRALQRLEDQMRAGQPANYPGGCDPSLARPDLVKFDLAQFATGRAPGADKMRQLEDRLSKGVLGELPEMDHWAIEEFLWHGLPGDSWHPVEAFLEHTGTRFPPAAHEQLQRWKEARIGLFQIGDVVEETVGLHEWDPVRRGHVGEPFRAITLNVGGPNVYKSASGQFILTHVAPWKPEDGLYCGMGYAAQFTQRQLPMAAVFLGLRHLEIAATPLPWRKSPSALHEHQRRWRQREWHSWLTAQLRFPFTAFVGLPPRVKMDIREVRGLLPSTPEEARSMGIYFEVPSDDETEIIAAGGTTVLPVDISSANRLALEEYHAYRKADGPPPGTLGMPAYTSVR
jgi:hypothetical protein